MIRRNGFVLALRARVIGALLAAVLAIPACASDRPPAQGPADDVKQRHEADLMSIPGGVGVGVGQCDEQACIKVFVEQETPELAGAVPTDLEGVPVELEAIGKVSAQ
jgi:hypothetical protein